MSSMVHLSRLLPHLCPALFGSAGASSEEALTFPREQVAPVAAATDQDAARSMRARQMDKLYHRTLRSQQHGGALTYSGLMSA